MSLWSEVYDFFVKAFGKPVPTTAGPDHDEHPIVPPAQPMPAVFAGGVWYRAVYMPAHPGRVGPAIVPKTLVVHTTDMMPDSFQALVKAWTTSATNGACAHFLIGRDATQGVVQFVPITKNGNHAGGLIHGNYKLPTGALLHPNVVAVGIELHGAGLLRLTNGKWVHQDSGRVVESSDVYVDSHKRGWHVITPYQLRMLAALIVDLGLPGLPVGTTVAPDATYASQGVADYAGTNLGPTIVGHCTLDPINKTDPGSQVMSWLKDNKYA